MKPFFTLHFPNAGRKFLLRTSVLYTALIRQLLEQDPDGGPDAANKAASEIAGDEMKLAIWAKDNLKWADLVGQSAMIKAEAPRLQDDWEDAAIQFHMAPVPAAEINSLEFMDMPIAAITARMAAEGQNVSILGIADESGEPNAAVILVRGQPDLVKGYIGVVSNFKNFIEQNEQTFQKTLLGQQGKPLVDGAANDQEPAENKPH